MQDVWGPILHPGARTSRWFLPVGGSRHRPHFMLRGRMGTESRRQPCPLHLLASGAMLQCSRDCCRSAGHLGSGWVPWSPGPAPCPQQCVCQAERRGCPGGGDVGSLPPSWSPCSIHLGSRGNTWLSLTCKFQPLVQDLISVLLRFLSFSVSRKSF